MDPDTAKPPSALLDGALATNLFAAGMPRGACNERWMLNHPAALQALQTAFVQAGCDVLYAPTFSANRPCLDRFGLGGETSDINRRLVQLTREVAQGCAVAGNLSPTGLSIEPYGETSFDLLCDIYAEQANALNEAGVDLFAIETMLSITEARAAVLACRRYGKPVWVTFTLNEHDELCSGASPLAALITLQELGISAFGFNCSHGPDQICTVIREIAPYAHLPLIAKPNAGLPNPLLPDVYEISPPMFAAAMERILDAGAAIVGGCCGSTAEHIQCLRKLIDSRAAPPDSISIPTPKEDIPGEDELLLTSFKELFLLSRERVTLSEPIACSLDMADCLLEAEEEGADVLQITVQSEEEALDFSRNAHLAKLPVCFHSDEEEALERVLFLYNGRALVDLRSAIPQEILASIAARYGAILY